MIADDDDDGDGDDNINNNNNTSIIRVFSALSTTFHPSAALKHSIAARERCRNRRSAPLMSFRTTFIFFCF